MGHTGWSDSPSAGMYNSSLCLHNLTTKLTLHYQPFLPITKQVEGNWPTRALVILEYVKLKNNLFERLGQAVPGNAIHTMLHTMINKTQGYLNKAVKCKTLVMAAMLNPMLGVSLFQEHFDFDTLYGAEKLFQQQFEDHLAQIQEEAPTIEADLPSPLQSPLCDKPPLCKAVY